MMKERATLKHLTKMKAKYIAPIIEVEEIVVEKGFAGSHGNGHAYGKAGKWDEIEEEDEWD